MFLTDDAWSIVSSQGEREEEQEGWLSVVTW